MIPFASTRTMYQCWNAQSVLCVQCISRKQFVSFNKNWVEIHDFTVSKFINGKVTEHLQFQYWMKLKYKLYEWIVTVTLAMTEWKCSPSAPYIFVYHLHFVHCVSHVMSMKWHTITRTAGLKQSQVGCAITKQVVTMV